MSESHSDALVLRRHRRPGVQEDLPGAPGDGETRPPQCAGHRRGQVGLDFRSTSGPGARQPGEHGGVDPAAFDKLSGLLRYVGRRLPRPGHVPSGAQGARVGPAAGSLPRHSARVVRRGRRAARQVRLHEGRPRHHRKAVRPRPRSAQELNRILLSYFRRERHLPHRPLPGQAAGAEPALLPLRQLVPGADLEPQSRRERPDHHGGELWRRRVAAPSTTRPAPFAT